MTCLWCCKELKLAPKYIRERGRAPTADGAPPLRGYEGNNAVCSLRCGFLVLLAVLQAEPNIASIFPPGWNERPRRSV